ncbi:7-cyano-7-deazaguanine synthase [Antarcticirhabdus aurantiaca]|uniref:7-cyano-7-deazaguanine synthase n=1 Tax=Antarcticirhabdus aurantiaca TaxID=2606717 RepID=A0ACD4NS22_9HYPH|nr:7-cyano-7-deazaguanine synthase [Antarcticirhabdus aurantiaca]WAJ29537.1 7-cyano-7-deazaguanine synthase [Jeongeuplla avenae]
MRLLLFSGGLDSSALAADLRPDLCLTVDYGQRPAAGEIRSSAAIAAALDLRHETLRVDLSALGSGDMAGSDASGLASGPEWWPYRNQMLITLAAMRYVTSGLSEIVIGAVGTDTHADGKAPFLEAIDRALAVQEGCVRVSAPARDADPVELLRRSSLPRELLCLTFSCHSGPYACGQCRGCTKRLATIYALDDGAVDPLPG